MSIYKNGKLIAGGRQCMPLLSFMWADHELNDASWLRADTFSWQSGAVYQAAYQHLVDDYNNTGEHLYGWSTDTFSKTPYPSVGDVLYRSDGTEWSTVAYVARDYSYIIRSDGVAQLNRNTSIDTVLYETHTETIAGVTITYYQAADGHKLVLPDQESNVTEIYSATGVAWYYILDTANQRFKLPRTKFGVTGLRDTVGNYVPESLPNIKGWFDIVNTTSKDEVLFKSIGSGNNSGATGGGTIRMQYNANRYNSTYQDDAPVQERATQMYLYFYVGNFTQTALENTAGLNASLFNEKVDVGHQVIAFQAPTAGNNYTWYRKYRDGWVEQGGLCSGTAENNPVTMPIEMRDTEYQVLAIADPTDSVNSWGWVIVSRNTKTTTGFSLGCRYGSGSVVALRTHWQVSGMAA